MDESILGPRCFMPFGRNSDDAVQLILEHGANAQLVDCHGCGFLHCVCNNSFVANILLQHGAQVIMSQNSDMNTLLLAASTGSCNIITWLLDRGFPINLVDDTNNTALHLACANTYWHTAMTLLNNGADINIKNNDGLTPFDIACHKASFDRRDEKDWIFRRYPQFEAVKLFLDRGALFDEQNTGGWTALHSAANGACVEMTAMLLTDGANLLFETIWVKCL
jgi:ankyrin repeat protein